MITLTPPTNVKVREIVAPRRAYVPDEKAIKFLADQDMVTEVRRAVNAYEYGQS